MKVALKELEKFIRDDCHLETGRPFKSFGDLRSRELLGNWLLCAALNSDYQTERLWVCSDLDCDGVIYDKHRKLPIPMEHIMVLKGTQDAETLILEAIDKKRKKGKPYASGKTLLVFLKKSGSEWLSNRVGRKLPIDLYFNDVWVFGLEIYINGKYIYYVVKLDRNESPVWKVKIRSDFNEWEVERIQ